MTLGSGAVVHHGRESPWGGSSLATVVETSSTACSHLSTSGDRDLGYRAGIKRLKSTSWALCIKYLITSPNSTTGCGPSVQTHEHSNTRARGRHFRFKPQHRCQTDMRFEGSAPAVCSWAGLAAQVQRGGSLRTISSPTYFLGEFICCLLFYF